MNNMWYIGYIEEEKENKPYFTENEIDGFKTLTHKEKNILRDMCGYKKKVVRPTIININYLIF